MMGEKITIRKTEDNYLICEDNLSVLSKINHWIIQNEMEELALNIFEKNKTENSLTFYINKQAALNNSFHMIDENMSPLGDIEVKIITDNPDEVIEWIVN